MRTVHMVFRQLVNQDRYDQDITVEQGIEYAKVLFKANNKPYILKDSVDGPLTKVVFTERFIYAMRNADSTECMADMSKMEKELYWDYINYQGIVNTVMFANPGYTDAQVDAAAKVEYELNSAYGTPELVVRTLSDWAYAETLKFDKDSCFDTMHKWEA